VETGREATGKMKHEHTLLDDISIGQNQWLKCESIASVVEPTAIDSLLLPTQTFWAHLETNCEAECCGIHAFDFWPEAVQIAATKCGIDHLASKLAYLEDQIATTPGSVVRSERLNCIMAKPTLRRLLSHIVQSLT
jgi:hypothetical protein